jgi:hypothetical protein
MQRKKGKRKKKYGKKITKKGGWVGESEKKKSLREKE